jgi:cytochrome c peroxidase
VSIQKIRIKFFAAGIFLLWSLLWICACRQKQITEPVISKNILPPGVPVPAQLAANADTHKIALGRHLFFDRRLSFNNTKSCATCHAPAFAFTDGYRRSLGATADMHQRNAQPLFNLVFLERFTSSDTSMRTLEQQMNNPLFNPHIIELGVKDHEKEVLRKFLQDPLYRRLYEVSFKEHINSMNWPRMMEAIAAFMKTIISAQSTYDRYTYYNDAAALDASALRGKTLFFSNRLQCGSCHSGFNFSGGLTDTSLPLTDRLYFNTGLYNVNGTGAYPAEDPGLYAHTKVPAHTGRIRVPTLRNLAFTGPYLHDGSAADLETVIDNYARGGRNIDYGNYRGDGKDNRYKDRRITGFPLSVQEKKDLIRFLYSLTDSSLLKNSAYQNPFTGDETKMKY